MFIFCTCMEIFISTRTVYLSNRNRSRTMVDAVNTNLKPTVSVLSQKLKSIIISTGGFINVFRVDASGWTRLAVDDSGFLDFRPPQKHVE